MTHVLIARHGDAAYHHPELISAEGGRLTELGIAQATRLGRQLRPERPVAVYASPMRRAEQTGEIVAAELGVSVSTLDGLQEFAVGEFEGLPDGNPGLRAIYVAWFDGDLDRRVPGAETGTELIARFRAAIDTIAAAHPGEAAVAVSHGGVMSVAVPHLCGNVPDELAQRHYLDNCCVVRVDVSDGQWSLQGDWPGRDQW